jgi:hypothetical protein
VALNQTKDLELINLEYFLLEGALRALQQKIFGFIKFATLSSKLQFRPLLGFVNLNAGLKRFLQVGNMRHR